jgi:hypothetical protein
VSQDTLVTGSNPVPKGGHFAEQKRREKRRGSPIKKSKKYTKTFLTKVFELNVKETFCLNTVVHLELRIPSRIFEKEKIEIQLKGK